MSGVKADWRLADLLDETEDPFDDMIYSSGLRVNLAGSEEELEAALVLTLQKEGVLWEQEVTCELKDSGQDCLLCTVAVMDPAEALSALCRLGRDQRNILRRCEARRDERVVGPYVELADSIAPFTEMGHLGGEYEELLAAAGL